MSARPNISVRLKSDLLSQLDIVAAKTKSSRGALIEKAVSDYINDEAPWKTLIKDAARAKRDNEALLHEIQTLSAAFERLCRVAFLNWEIEEKPMHGEIDKTTLTRREAKMQEFYRAVQYSLEQDGTLQERVKHSK